MSTISISTERVRRLRTRRQNGIVMTVPIQVGETGIELLQRNGLLDAGEEQDRAAVSSALIHAIEQWAVGQSARTTTH